METIQELFLVLLSAVILQNTLLARGLIPGRDDLKQACSGHVWAFGAGLGLVACLSTLLSWPLYKLVQRSSLLHEKAPVRYFIVLICLCLSYLFLVGDYPPLFSGAALHPARPFEPCGFRLRSFRLHSDCPFFHL